MALTKPDTPDKIEQKDPNTLVRWSMQPREYNIQKLKDEKNHLLERLSEINSLLENVQ